MAEYALLMGGVFKGLRQYAEKPPDILHKQVTWHDVVRDSGSSLFVGLENNNWVIRKALPTLEELRAQKIAELAALRWKRETSGTTFSGIALATDAVSQTKYIGAVVGAQIDPSAVVKWKMAGGSFVELDATAMTAVAMAVRAHVQACFDNEATLYPLIEAAETKEALDAVDIHVGWPA